MAGPGGNRAAASGMRMQGSTQAKARAARSRRTGACPPLARGVPCDAPAPAGAAQLAALATRAPLGQGAARMKHEARCARRRCCCASRRRTGAPAPGGPRLCRYRGGLRRQRPRCPRRADACERRVTRERRLRRCCEHHTRLRCEHRFRLRPEHYPRCLSGSRRAAGPRGLRRCVRRRAAQSRGRRAQRASCFILAAPCPSGARTAREASCAARPRGEQRRGVGAQHRPPCPAPQPPGPGRPPTAATTPSTEVEAEGRRRE